MRTQVDRQTDSQTIRHMHKQVIIKLISGLLNANFLTPSEAIKIWKSHTLAPRTRVAQGQGRALN